MSTTLDEAHAPPAPLRIEALLARLAGGLVERDEQARCVLLAALCGEHVLMIGPPGTAKSELARRLRDVVGGRWFERLLTRFTVPEELFGPLSLAALDEGRYQREIDGYLPTASVAFLDEIFKANSAILNALLTLLNERAFDQGPARIAVPLLTLVAASNESPSDESLRAFHDRFLFRCPVPPVSDAGFVRLLGAGVDVAGGVDGRAGGGEARAGGGGGDSRDDSRGEERPARGEPVSRGQIAALAARALAVVVPEAIVAALSELRGLLAEAGVEVSDRRWVRSVRALRVTAATLERGAVSTCDLWILRWLLAADAAQAERLDDWLARRLGGERAMQAERLSRLAQAWERQLEVEDGATELAFDDAGKLALAERLGGASEEQVRAAAPRMSAFSRRRRFSPSHVRARTAQLDAVLAQVDDWLSGCEAHRKQLLAELAGHPWIAPGFRDRVAGNLADSLAVMRTLRGSLAESREAFAALPLADVDDGIAPEPVRA